MLTPQNSIEKNFEKTRFGGYDTADVDKFLEDAANDYSAITKENLALKGKMKILVEKIEEYRATEDTMRLTLLSAQKLGLQIETEAREKAGTMLADARNEADRITREAYTQRAAEEAKLEEAKKSSVQFIENMRLLCTKQLEFLENIDTMNIENSLHFEVVDEAVHNIESSVERMANRADDSNAPD